ncbi:MAG: hypothetical protein IPK82_06780 [Polyangiaceae bacterium]|nr:hypothetical protein [Polyangiaceae bacterium]
MKPKFLLGSLAFSLISAAVPAFAQDEAKAPAASTAAPAAASSSASPAAAPAPSTAAPSKAPAESTAVDPWYRFRPNIELGFLAVLSNRIQFGRQGTYFDYQRYGGQDNLTFVARLSVDVELAKQHNLIFLYQPLELNTRAQLAEELIVDEARFAPGTPMTFKYGFPFYRFSYMYDFFQDDGRELSIGLSAQIRNATIEFATADGEVLKSYRDIGFVPLLKSRGRYTFKNGLFIGHEIDGIYAPIRGVNGSDNEVTGALVDASLRVGLKLPLKSEAFLNIRYLAGGATGQSDPEDFSDGRTKNWLQFMTVSLGGTISSF